MSFYFYFFFFQAEDGIRDKLVTGVQMCSSDLAEHDRRVPRPSYRHRVRGGAGVPADGRVLPELDGPVHHPDRAGRGGRRLIGRSSRRGGGGLRAGERGWKEMFAVEEVVCYLGT